MHCIPNCRLCGAARSSPAILDAAWAKINGASMEGPVGVNLRCVKIVWLDFCFLVRIRLYSAAGLPVSCRE